MSKSKFVIDKLTKLKELDKLILNYTLQTGNTILSLTNQLLTVSNK